MIFFPRKNSILSICIIFFTIRITERLLGVMLLCNYTAMQNPEDFLNKKEEEKKK